MSYLVLKISHASESHFARWSALLLFAMVGVLYSPLLSSFFNSDDFSFLRALHFNIGELLNWQHLNEWLVGGIVNYTVFRPMAHVYWLLDYTAFVLEPLGYHVVAILFHATASFAACILAYLLTRRRIISLLAALLFAAMPVHAEAIGWLAANYDAICAIYLFLSIAFYILYREKHAVRFYFIALGLSLLALSSREMALMIPALLFAYDLSYHTKEMARPFRLFVGYIPFWIGVAARLFFGAHGYRGLLIAPEGWQYYVDFNLLRVFDPFVQDTGGLRWIALGCAIVLVLLYRFRPVVVFSLLWIPISAFPTTVGGVNDRSFYIPSFGVAVLLAIALASLLSHRLPWARIAGMIALVVLIIAYGVTLFSRNQTYARASGVAKSILDQVKELHPTVSPQARFVFVGVPDTVPEGPPIFGAGLSEALGLVYDNPWFQAFKYDKFPIWLDGLDQTYFFQVDHRHVTERGDLIAALQARKRCADISQPAITWDFAKDSQGWEPWNDLEGFESRDGTLVMRATGNDPSIGSPELELSSLAIANVEITMLVRGGGETFTGELYWTATGQQDFSPGLKKGFVGPADGTFHTYSVEIGNSGLLLLGDRITQLRLDPVSAPSEVAIRSIRINTHCASATTDLCACPN